MRLALRKHWPLPDEEDFRYTGSVWLLFLLNQVNQGVAKLISLMLWRTWSMRNDGMHGEKLKPAVVSVDFLLSFAESPHLCCPRVGKADPKGKQAILSELEHRIYEKNKSSPLRTSLCWEPLEHGWVKVNVDGAFDQLTGRAGIGIIIRDSSGKPDLCAWKANSDELNAEETELLPV
jgi:hypothetical protein